MRSLFFFISVFLLSVFLFTISPQKVLSQHQWNQIKGHWSTTKLLPLHHTYMPFLHWTTSIMMKYRSLPWPWKDWQSCFCCTLSVSYTLKSNNYICYWVFITRAKSRNCFNFLTPLQHRLLRHGGRSDLEDEASPYLFIFIFMEL